MRGASRGRISSRHPVEKLSIEHAPWYWAYAKAGLGKALLAMGENGSDTYYAEQAVDAFNDALKVVTPERDPAMWAWTKYDLGDALVELGERSSGVRYLKEAVDTYREVLTVCSKGRFPTYGSRLKTTSRLRSTTCTSADRRAVDRNYTRLGAVPASAGAYSGSSRTIILYASAGPASAVVAIATDSISRHPLGGRPKAGRVISDARMENVAEEVEWSNRKNDDRGKPLDISPGLRPCGRYSRIFPDRDRRKNEGEPHESDRE